MAHAFWVDNSDGAAELMDPYWAKVVWGLDSDGDDVADSVDNCVDLANAPPLNCDTDRDGYGNPCDGDFDQSNTVNPTDFTAYFIPDFTATTDSGIGSDMDVSGGCATGVLGQVNPTDFTGYFIPQFTATAPGPSGLACAGDPAEHPCNP